MMAARQLTAPIPATVAAAAGTGADASANVAMSAQSGAFVCMATFGQAFFLRLSFLRLSGTTPPLSASFVMTCLCSQTFISAEPSSVPL